MKIIRPKALAIFDNLPFPAVIKKGKKVVFRNRKKRQQK
jgi:hypothetical protein